MKKILCAICVSLLTVGAVQAQQSISLDLPPGGPDPIADGSAFTTSVTDSSGATYDIEYTLNAVAADETTVDAFLKCSGQGTHFGVGSVNDAANPAQQESVDGSDGEQLLISNLSITNFDAGGSSLVASDLSIAFETVTFLNGGNAQDGINFSFTSFADLSADNNATRPGFVDPNTGVAAQPAQVDLTALANYDATSTSLYMAPDNLGNTNRWSVSGISAAVTGGTAPPTTLLGDVDVNGEVNFSDIGPFISVLSSGMFQAEADCDESGEVNFSDIAAFIAILSGP